MRHVSRLSSRRESVITTKSLRQHQEETTGKSSVSYSIDVFQDIVTLDLTFESILDLTAFPILPVVTLTPINHPGTTKGELFFTISQGCLLPESFSCLTCDA